MCAWMSTSGRSPFMSIVQRPLETASFWQTLLVSLRTDLIITGLIKMFFSVFMPTLPEFEVYRFVCDYSWCGQCARQNSLDWIRVFCAGGFPRVIAPAFSRRAFSAPALWLRAASMRCNIRRYAAGFCDICRPASRPSVCLSVWLRDAAALVVL